MTRRLQTMMVATLLAASASRTAAQDATPNLTRPTSTVELGLLDVSRRSFKAGEYSGLQDQGGVGIGHVDLRGGAAYTSDSALRWRVTGVDLGVAGRHVAADVGVQGKARLTFVYDELLRNRSDSYQSIFTGVGSSVLTLPAGWQVPIIAGATTANSVVTTPSARGLIPGIGAAPYIDLRTGSATQGGVLAPTAAQTALVTAAGTTDRGLFRDAALSTTRTRFHVAAAYQFTPQWGVEAGYRPEHKDGLKPLGAISRATGGDIAVIIPDVVDSDDHQVDAAVHFRGAKSFLQAGYTGSFFTNHIGSMTFQNWALGPTDALTTTTMSSAPSNTYGQLTVTGGYHPSATTHLTAHAAYARTTQNDAFLTDSSTPVVPVASLQGLVVRTAVDAKATTRLTRALQLTAAYKFDDRDNQTAVHTYQFMDANQALAANPAFAAGTVLATNVGANRAYSQRQQQVTGDLDWRLRAGQTLRAGYAFDRIGRACPGSWTDCANVATTRDHAGHADWRLALGQDLTLRAGGAYAVRRGDYNENAFLALVPMANVSPLAATGGMTYAQYLAANNLNGWGPALGFAVTTGNANVFFPANSETHLSAYAWENRIAELPGMRRYDVADRTHAKGRASLDWQATEALSLQVGVTAETDDYLHSRYGLTDARNHGVSLDGTYAGETRTATLSYTFEDRRSTAAGNTLTNSTNATNVLGATGLSNPTNCGGYTTLQQRNNNNKLDPCLDWTSARTDRVHTVLAGLTQKVGALDLTADALLSRARGDHDFTGGTWANNLLLGAGAAPSNIAAVYIPVQALPAVTTDSAEVRVHGTYALTSRMAVRLAYAYLWMQSDDYAYQGLQTGAATIINVLPTNETAFTHGVHVFGASYVFRF